MKSHSPPDSKRFVQNMTVVLLMLVFFAQLMRGSLSLSMTSDEPPHLINGYVALKTGDTWTVPPHGHPPLINAWSAWPLLLQPEQPDMQALRPWINRNFIRFVRAMWPLLGPIERLAFVGRVPIMLLAVVLMALVYRWARDWFGPGGGILAIGLMALDPTMIAHSQLNTTDIGMTLTGFASLYLVSRLLQDPAKRWRLVIGIGVLLGATMAGKGSGTMLAPVILAMLGWGYVRETGSAWRAWLGKRRDARTVRSLLRAAGRWAGYALSVLGISVLCLWAVYRFEWRALPLAAHIRMLQIILEQKDRVSFLNGVRHVGGAWWYFPFAYAIKTPIPLMIALAAALVVALRRRWRVLQDEMVLWFFPILYALTAMQSGLNIGYRHLLPTFPFIYVSIGRLAPQLFHTQPRRWSLAACVVATVLGMWYIAGTVSVYPFSLAYFNEFVGGPRNGYRYLVDSNVDWGQQFKALKTELDRRGIGSVQMSYYTWIDPAVYGIHYEPLFPAAERAPYIPRQYDPAPGDYVLSATTLQGISMVAPELYDWFRHREPVAQPGYGLLLYHVPPRDPPARWIAQCSVPVAPLTTESMTDGLGRTDLRQVYFDCTRSWVYPEGGHSFGWYGIFRETWLKRDHFLDDRLASVHLSFEQTESHREPAFVLFEWNHAAAPHLPQTQVTSAPSDWPPAQVLAQGPSLTAPVEFNGPLTFLGYQVVSSNNKAIELETVWQVESTPGRPLSVMAHLLNADNRPVATGDGLGVPVDQWRAGDVIVQRHTLTIPDATPPGAYWLQTGLYWLDTLERMPLKQSGYNTGDRILLIQVNVK